MIQVVEIKCPKCGKGFKVEGDCFDVGEEISCFRCDALLRIIQNEPVKVEIIEEGGE